MPDFTGSAAAIRASGYSIRAYASFYAPAPIVEATCAGTSGAIPSSVLYVNITSGSDTDIHPGYRVDVSDSGAAFKGSTRIRFGNMITPNVFPVREFSVAKLNMVAGDLVKVYQDIRLSDKLPEANQFFLPDGTPYTDQGSNPPPIACSGGHWAGRVDSGQTFATIPMTGSTSYWVDPDSNEPLTHLWTLPAGVAFQSGSANTDADPVLEADVGQHFITHAVTDADNSKTTTQNVVLMVTDDTTTPHKVVVSAYDGKPESGFNFACEVLEGAVDTATIPDGCLCILWARERVAGAWQSIRNTSDGREHILAIGYVRRENLRRAGDGKTRLTFELISPLARLRELTSYSKVMEYNATPDAWSKVKVLSVRRGIIQIVQFYSTLVESGFDLLWDTDVLDEVYPALYLQRSNFVDQITELTRGIDARLTSDRTGRFDVHTEPPFIPYADRAAVTTTWALTGQDILDIDVKIESVSTVEIYKTSGFNGGASANVALYSLYPGIAPGEGIDAPTRDRLIVDDVNGQADLNARTGRYGALADKVLYDGDGLLLARAAEITLTLRGVYNFFDFLKEFVTLTLNLGRRVYTGARFYPTSTHTGYDVVTGAPTTTLTLMQETNALPGETFVPEVQSTAPYTPWEYTPQPQPTPASTSRLPAYGADTLPLKFVILDANGANAALLTNFTTTPAYTDISTGLTGYGIWLCPDPYDYRKYYALMSTGLYVCANVWAFTTWTLVGSNATIYGDAARMGMNIIMSINRRGYIGIASGTNMYIYSTDYGATWNRVRVVGVVDDYSTVANNILHFSAEMSSHNGGSVGWIWGTTYHTTYHQVLSEDWGATWTDVANTDTVSQGGGLAVPHIRVDGTTANDNDASQQVYLQGGKGHPTNSANLYRTNNKGVAWGLEYTVASGGVQVPSGSYTGRSMQTFTHDGAIVASATLKTGAGSISSGVRISEDGGATTLNVTELFAQGNLSTCLNGFSQHSGFWVAWCRVSGAAGDGVMYYTADHGVTWHSIALPTGFTGGVKLAACIVPDLSDFIAPA